MISVLISSESRYKFEKEKVRQQVEKILKEAGVEEVEVSILVVGSRKMRALNREFRQLNEESLVLAFPQEAPRGPDGILRLGDIVISYPLARAEAALENQMVDEQIGELVEHGLKHLLGEDREEKNG